MQEETISMQDIFVFDRLGIGANGKVLGRFRATGIRPSFTERLERSGIHLPPGIFTHSFEV